MFRVLVLLCLGLLTLASQREAIADQRVALVIGNSTYANAPMLRQPAKDAEAMGALLKSAGFDKVAVHRDLSLLQMRAAIRKFADESQDANIAVIFYAGHGLELDGTNYLIPVDAKLEDILDTQYEAVSLDRFFDSVNSAGTSRRLNIIILDACRDNPFPAMKRQRLDQTTGIYQAHRRESLTDDHTLIAYSCKQGPAEDGDGDHSPFTQALLNSLTVPGLDIRLAFGRVRNEVLNKTANKQEPFVYGALQGELLLLVQAAAQQKEVEADVEADFNMVATIGTKKAFEVFLQTHKTGKYADLARARLNKLNDPGCVATGRNQDASNNSLADQLAGCVEQRKSNNTEKR
jgi:uncharacterized caspase-like protein